MLQKWFGKEASKLTKTETIIAPISGDLIPIEKVPDPTFSEKLIGEGVAIKPNEGEVVSPIDGEVIQLFPTKHAIALRGNSGVELLIHIGLGTVNLNGESFHSFVTQGQKVSVGDKLLSFNLNLINQKVQSSLTPTIITNYSIVDTLEIADRKEVKGGETEIMQIHINQ
ncbi:PTS system glucose-specific IIA component [Salirhabdus euzebyi]|uniref:PTS system glucose-specific IIA component n=1 Tax=Salirhabdus euzebyi TaxID=394506 RepID=A0A841Q5R3_9BACI|nr:PTS glucose transporter subunit IIA [Salirhabdus euzebyi]MBB6453809.1 PTS system glucose-specific IIA component [Salirhabdus euzebyi]